MKLPAKQRLVALIVFGLLYSSAYWTARSSHWLVHRTGYYSVEGQDKKLDGHYITQGDFGTPMLSPLLSLAQGVSVIALWPAVQLELLYWRFAAPRGSPWKTQTQPIQEVEHAKMPPDDKLYA